ncbi:HD domain-containing protein [Anaerocolumna sedimenticola]|uniref:HD domain-containing protein n=1 Tax=Anaerocolumna sedimenticola TaxID=2696063 RepID=A0A6P1TI15_9FIRM|nr:HD domain-containing protein [Anaerocolumna sedimenticola]QHQ59566.1 HD domain-containing protein [Anaerocolumna sedimenticola]
MIPTREAAELELQLASELNPGPWINHSKNVARAAEIISRFCKLDGDKAYIFGLLHDIGRRNGPSAVKHTIDGYRYMLSKSWDEVAVICLTHSYPTKSIYHDIGKMDITLSDQEEMDQFIQNYNYNDYDKLIILCDALALPDRLCILEQRFVDTTIRYGVWPFTVLRWTATYELKKYFESKIGCSLYEILPEIKESFK